jgi:outer membrane lipoprotein SlyB
MKRLLALLLGFVVLSLVPSGSYAQATNSGTEIKVRLLGRLDTSETPVGRAFSATVEEPVRLDKKTVLAKGTTVKGTVTEVVSSGRLKRPASITLQLTGLGSRAIRTEPLQIDGKSHAVRNTALIGGGAAVGAILGGIAGGGKGALIGTAVGAGAGTGTAYVTGKQEIVLPSETELTFIIASDAPATERSASAKSHSTASSYTSDSQRWREDPREDEQEQREENDAYDVSTTSSEHGQQFAIGILIGPPPPPRVVYVEPTPGPEFVWVEGYWYPVGRRYEWHDGYWTRPPYDGARWAPAHYDGQRFFEGYWEGDRGRIEHDHRWDHDRDRDFRSHHRDRDHDNRDHDDDRDHDR